MSSARNERSPSTDTLAVRAAIRSGELRGAALLDRILAVTPAEREAWVDATLGIPEAPVDEALPRGAVPYVPAGVGEILTALSEIPVRATDEFVDIGSGLGRVVFLAHLLTGARAHGVEIQGSLVRLARRVQSELGLSEVTFERADASDVPLRGTVFFLYSPLTGEALRRVLMTLREIGEKQPITLCAVGLTLDHETWLERRSSKNAAVTFYGPVPPVSR